MRKKLALYGMAAGLALTSLTGCSATADAGQTTTTAAVEVSAEESLTEAEGQTEAASAADDLTESESESEAGMLAQMEPLVVWGQVTGISKENNKITINNQSGNSVKGEMVLNITEETKTVDAVDALPVDWSSIAEGDFIYTYIGPTMTMSLPPMTNAQLIISQIPADYKVPVFVKVSAMEMQEDRSYILTAVGGAEYTVPEDCPVQPYLVKMMVYLENIQEGDTALIWTDAENQVSKIVLFAE